MKNILIGATMMLGLQANAQSMFEVYNKYVVPQAPGVTMAQELRVPPSMLLGRYNQVNNHITIYPNSIKFMAKAQGVDSIDLAIATTKHEAKHGKMDVRSEELGLGNFPNAFPNLDLGYKILPRGIGIVDEIVKYNLKSKIKPRKMKRKVRKQFPEVLAKHEDTLFTMVLQRMVGEGYATYFDDTTKNPGALPEILVHPTKFMHEIQISKLFYHHGHQLVYPILKGRGDEALDYLLLHPPQKEDYFDLKAYQERAIAALEGK